MGTKNKITDLNNHLFAAIERLSDEDITPEELDKEIKRSSAIKQVADTVIESGKLQVEAMKILQKSGYELDKSSVGLLNEG